MKENTPKNFVIQLGSLIALYVSVTALMVLIFGVINIKFPDEVASYWQGDSAREAVRASIAVLIIFFPTYLGLTRVSNQIRRKEEGGRYTGLAKWLIYLSLLVAGVTMLIDLVTVLKYFLDGEITIRFILKAASLFIVLGVSFSYYILDVKGAFKNNEKKSMMFGAAASLLVIAGLVLGFMNIEAPSEVREMRLDEQQTNDLQNIQYLVEESYRFNKVLPATIDELYDGVPAPEAPEGREPYEYKVTGETTYQLCATFVAATPQSMDGRSYPIEKNYNWTHGEGEKCFDRVVEKQIPEPMKI